MLTLVLWCMQRFSPHATAYLLAESVHFALTLMTFKLDASGEGAY